MWVLPMKGCNAGSVYADQPVGDLPEMMPLDLSLFEDLHTGIHHHMTRTTLLPNDDPKKFSLATPKECAQAYTRIFQPSNDLNVGIPCSRRILEDCKKFITNCEEVRKARGVVVPGLGSRSGHQKENVRGVANENQGGKHTKTLLPEMPCNTATISSPTIHWIFGKIENHTCK